MYNLHSPADTREAHAHSVPYAPLATVLDTIEEVKAVAKQQQNLPLFALCKMLAQVACIAYTSPAGGQEKEGPAIYNVPPVHVKTGEEFTYGLDLRVTPETTVVIGTVPTQSTAQSTAPGTPLAAQLHPQANPPAATAGQGVGLDPTPPYTLDVVLRITFEKPVDVSEHKLRQDVKDMVGCRAWTMNNVKFVEVL